MGIGIYYKYLMYVHMYTHKIIIKLINVPFCWELVVSSTEVGSAMTGFEDIDEAICFIADPTVVVVTFLVGGNIGKGEGAGVA